MEITEVEVVKKIAKQRKHCSQNTLPSYEYGYFCISGGYKVIKRKNEISKISTKKINFFDRFHFAEHNTFGFSIDVFIYKKVMVSITFMKLYRI